MGEACNREAKRAGLYMVQGGKQEANWALKMALCEINQMQPCPFSLRPTDKGLIWGERVRGILIKEHPSPLTN